MSRMGRRPIAFSSQLEVSLQDTLLKIQGPKGKLEFQLPPLVELQIEQKSIQIQADYKGNRTANAMMGTTYSIINNMILGVTEGFTKRLDLVGVGYRASLSGNTLELNLGYSHPIRFQLPQGITAQLSGNTKILLESCDKQLLGQVAANIRKLRPPEPYKGKGILVEGEKILKKSGKSGKK